jgi:phosphoglycolate phosphatase
MNVRGIIFDLDGTLLDTLEDIAFSMNAALVRFGAPAIAVNDYRQHVGRGLDVLAWSVLPESSRNDETVRQCVAAMREVYATRWSHSTKPYPGIVALLDSLKHRRIPLAVFSNKAHDFTVKIVTHYFGAGTFSAILGGGEFPFKPAPAGALHITRSMDVPAGEMLYVGDSDIDMQTAVNAGMYPAGVTWGFRSRQELLENGALVLIDKPDELIDLTDRYSLMST